MASLTCHVFGVTKQVRLERIVRPQSSLDNAYPVEPGPATEARAIVRAAMRFQQLRPGEATHYPPTHRRPDSGTEGAEPNARTSRRAPPSDRRPPLAANQQQNQCLAQREHGACIATGHSTLLCGLTPELSRLA